MRYCKRCLATDLRPNAEFSDDGVCIACQFSFDQSWSSNNPGLRLEQLKTWLTELRRRRGRKHVNPRYDCAVGVSGGKDSTRQALWVRDRLGLNPLLVCCGYPPVQMTEIGGNNLSNLIRHGFDIEVVTPAPQSSAKLSRESFYQFGNVCKSTELALFASVPRVAVEKKIPLIFWGENPATQVGDAAALGENIFDGNRLREVNTLVEGGYDWLRQVASDQKCKAYEYPSPEDMRGAGVSLIYLGPVWDDWGEDDNAEFAALEGLELRPGDSSDTGDISGACMLDEEFTNINMMIKYYKFGFGRATDLMNTLIRSGKISRSEAIDWVERYDGVCSDRIIGKYCSYIDIAVSEFWLVVDRYVNKNLFMCEEGSRPRPRFTVGENL